jgi:dolichyl-phosphate-mannose--protein O-mannosyl transferase
VELLTPGIELIFWEVFIGCVIVCTAIAWLILAIDKSQTTNRKLVWLAITLLLPIIGSVWFLIRYNTLKENSYIHKNY